jgi:hypothetical protein
MQLLLLLKRSRKLSPVSEIHTKPGCRPPMPGPEYGRAQTEINPFVARNYKAVKAYALISNDILLKSEVDYSASELQEMSQDNLYDAGSKIIWPVHLR